MSYGREYRARHFRELDLRPQWGEPHPSDPNWADGQYHGNRMRGDNRQAAYGLHRLHHQRDVGGSGGFDGRYDSGPGWHDRQGYFHDPFEESHPRFAARGYDRGYRGGREWHPGYAYDARGEERDGGVRDRNQYLRQYNAESPALQGGRAYDRSYGHAGGPTGRPGGWDESGGPRRRPTDERGYAGYNTGGFAEGKQPGPGTRGSIPNR